jgi:hypothetical protein
MATNHEVGGSSPPGQDYLTSQPSANQSVVFDFNGVGLVSPCPIGGPIKEQLELTETMPEPRSCCGFCSSRDSAMTG